MNFKRTERKFSTYEFAYANKNALLGMERHLVIKEGFGRDVLSRTQFVISSIC